ncbi:hypothetical protein Psm1vBMR14_gp31c [Pseudomonas phage MR14]|nr:hypothetical protein Psm1vBMR14_gp31c [Pseudomonas phage MR14]
MLTSREPLSVPLPVMRRTSHPGAAARPVPARTSLPLRRVLPCGLVSARAGT